MKTIKILLVLGLGLFSACRVRATEAQSLTINADGYLALSDGAPLDGYRADDAVIARWHSSPSVTLALELQKKQPFWRAALPEEIVGILAYIGAAYQSVNSALWHGALPQNPDDMDTVKLVLSGINKLPDFKGGVIRADFYRAGGAYDYDADAVTRRAETYRAAMNGHKPFLPKGFWSASRVSTAAARRKIMSGSDMTLKIHSLTGKSLGSLSEIQGHNEEEVLFRPGARFAVVKETSQNAVLANGKRKTRYQFTLCELPPDGGANCCAKICCAYGGVSAP